MVGTIEVQGALISDKTSSEQKCGSIVLQAKRCNVVLLYLQDPSQQYPSKLTRFLCRTRLIVATSILKSFSAWPLFFMHNN
jgi:hypothetical protein